jgi:hypothetical protein
MITKAAASRKKYIAVPLVLGHWCLNAEDMYRLGKIYWPFMDSIKDGSCSLFKAHLETFGGDEEMNAVKIANEILGNKKKLGDFFPKQQKAVQEDLKTENNDFAPSQPNPNPRFRLQSGTDRPLL